MKHLMNVVSELLCNKISIDNFADILSLTQAFQVPLLYKSCHEFIKEHLQVCYDTGKLHSLPLEELLKIFLPPWPHLYDKYKRRYDCLDVSILLLKMIHDILEANHQSLEFKTFIEKCF